MATLADHAQALFAQAHRSHPYFAVAATPLGFGLAVWLARNFFPNSQGSGIPQCIAALEIEDQGARENWCRCAWPSARSS